MATIFFYTPWKTENQNYGNLWGPNFRKRVENLRYWQNSDQQYRKFRYYQPSFNTFKKFKNHPSVKNTKHFIGGKDL